MTTGLRAECLDRSPALRVGGRPYSRLHRVFADRGGIQVTRVFKFLASTEMDQVEQAAQRAQRYEHREVETQVV